jgi:hypothetical protein
MLVHKYQFDTFFHYIVTVWLHGTASLLQVAILRIFSGRESNRFNLKLRPSARAIEEEVSNKLQANSTKHYLHTVHLLWESGWAQPVQLEIATLVDFEQRSGKEGTKVKTWFRASILLNYTVFNVVLCNLTVLDGFNL